jgi:hypothetical protein
VTVRRREPARPLCWGIFRERAHSPGRENDDTEILRLTSKHLEARGYPVDLKDPEDVSDAIAAPPRAIFLMCEREEVLAQLAAWERGGTRMVNSPGAVLATYRERMVAQFEEAGVAFVKSRLVATPGRYAGVPSLPVWVKRGDVHNTQEGDVVLAQTEAAVDDALGRLHARGIARAVLQPHVAGDLIKFYGIGPGGGADGVPPWFRWFYHRDQVVAGHPLDARQLAHLARRAAGALGLEIYGGDAIATADGGLVLLDLNAWPSFALYREEAAPAIAAYLALRFDGGTR